MRFLRKSAVLDAVRDHPGCTVAELAMHLYEDYGSMTDRERSMIRSDMGRPLYDLWKQNMIEPTQTLPRRWTVCDGPPKNPKVRKHRSKGVEYMGRTLPLREWCRVLGLNYNMVKCRVYRGWTVKEALEVPQGGKRGEM